MSYIKAYNKEPTMLDADLYPLASISDEELLHRYDEYEFILESLPKYLIGTPAHDQAEDRFIEYWSELDWRTAPNQVLITTPFNPNDLPDYSGFDLIEF